MYFRNSRTGSIFGDHLTLELWRMMSQSAQPCPHLQECFPPPGDHFHIHTRLTKTWIATDLVLNQEIVVGHKQTSDISASIPCVWSVTKLFDDLLFSLFPRDFYLIIGFVCHTMQGF